MPPLGPLEASARCGESVRSWGQAAEQCAPALVNDTVFVQVAISDCLHRCQLATCSKSICLGLQHSHSMTRKRLCVMSKCRIGLKQAQAHAPSCCRLPG